MIARSLTKEGISRFIEYIQEVKKDSSAIFPDLNSVDYSVEFKPQFEINENISFNTRMQMGKYLSDCIKISDMSHREVLGVGKESSLWTWLAYIWFYQITNRKTLIRESARYICRSDYRHYYRHSVATSYYLYSVLGEENARLFLYSPPYKHNDFIEQFASRQHIISYPNLIKCAHILYWDSRSNSPKKGAQSDRRLGNHKRFIKIISQFELTFDIYSMNENEILNILPKEFDQWIN